MPDKALDRLVAGVEACVQNGVDVILLALGPPSTKFDPADPLQVATKTAYDKNIPVVVAAGNFGARGLQAFARAPWVISVGAVDASEHLLPVSSTGLKAGEGPTVVSYGLPPEIANPDPKWEKFGPGTSFAVPKVAGISAFGRACLRLIISDLDAQQSKRWSFMSSPVKVPVIGLVDTGVDPTRLPPLAPAAQWDIQHGHTHFQFPRPDAEEQWYASVVQALKNAGVACTLSDGPESVKRMLQLMARPLHDYANHQVGAGLVSIDEALAFISSLTPSRWLGIFCPEAVQKLGAAGPQLDKKLGALWNANKVIALKLHLFDGIRLVVIRVD